MNLLADWDVGILYLSTKFELDQSTNNGDLLSDRDQWKHKNTHRLKLTLFPYSI